MRKIREDKPQGNSLCSYIYLKQVKIWAHIYMEVKKIRKKEKREIVTNRRCVMKN
jgi:hypothetical protein